MASLLPMHHFISVKRGGRGYDHEGVLTQSMPFDASDPTNYKNSTGIAYSAFTDETAFPNDSHQFTVSEAAKWYYKCSGINIDGTTYNFPITDKTEKAHSYAESMVVKSSDVGSAYVLQPSGSDLSYYAFSPSFDFVNFLDGSNKYAFIRYEHGETALGHPSSSSDIVFTGDPVFSKVAKRLTISDTLSSGSNIASVTVTFVGNEDNPATYTEDLSTFTEKFESQLTMRGNYSSASSSFYYSPTFSTGPGSSFSIAGFYADDSAFNAAISAINNNPNAQFLLSSVSINKRENIKVRTKTFEGVNYYQQYYPFFDITHELA